jgi:SAM-dependent methyltransferase
MWTDVVDLRDFYDSSLGQMAIRMIGRRIRGMWPSVRAQRVLGLGYAAPYLSFFRQEAERTLAVMPASQGVIHWPNEGPGLVTLADEADIPLPDLSIDRILLVHAIENSEQLRRMLRETWRILSDSGRLLVVVPNRRGVWAQFAHTPFGHGHPYTVAQLSRLLRDNLFTPARHSQALFAPPLFPRMVVRSARVCEEVGSRGFSTFGGVILMDAGKQIYAAPPLETVRRRVFLPLPEWPAPSTMERHRPGYSRGTRAGATLQ